MPELPPLLFLTFPGGVFRPLLESDVEILLRATNDPEVRLYLNRYLPETLESERAWLTSLSKRNEHNIVLGMEVKGKLIGSMGIHGINWKNRTATTGTMIWDISFWNQGIGTQAKMVLLKFAFHTLNLRQIYSDVIGFNGRSARYAEKCGYELVGTTPEDHYFEGRYHDVYKFMVTRTKWEVLWEKFFLEHNLETLEDTLSRHRAMNRAEK